MSYSSDASSYPLSAYIQDRPISPEIVEIKTIKDPFFKIIDSAVSLLKTETQEHNLLSTYLDRVASEIPKNEDTNKVISLIASYSQGLVSFGQAEAPDPKDKEAFKTWFYDTSSHANLFLDCQCVKDVIEVTIPEDLQQYLSVDNPQELCCFDYALCQISETRTLLTEYTNSELPGLLIEWGYQPIRDMEPGDLVLYLKDGFPTHLGLHIGDGLVQSKWGNSAPVAYLHQLETAPVSYGNQVLIFRPPYLDADIVD